MRDPTADAVPSLLRPGFHLDRLLQFSRQSIKDEDFIGICDDRVPVGCLGEADGCCRAG